MPTTVDSHGRVTVPKTIRDYLGLRTGSAVTFERLSSGEVVIRAGSARAKLTSLRGRANVRMMTEAIMALTRGD